MAKKQSSIDKLFDYESRLKKKKTTKKKAAVKNKEKPVMKKQDKSIKGRANSRKQKLGDIMNSIRQGR